MGERKVLNKYFPPDFDPAKVPRTKRPKESQIVIRMMLPMTLRCKTCGEYMYMGKKFNSRKETVQDEEYLGLQIFRFYMKCVVCGSEFTIKTDPKNSDYVAERNVLRSTEPWRKQRLEDEAKEKEEQDAEKDSMKVLEKRTLSSKAEMDALDELDELKAISAIHAKVDAESLISEHRKRHQELLSELEKQDEEITRRVFSGEGIVRRLSDGEGSGSEGENEAKARRPSMFSQRRQESRMQQPPSKRRKLAVGAITVQSKPKSGLPVAVERRSAVSSAHGPAAGGGGGEGSGSDGGLFAGLAGYGSSASGSESASEKEK